MARSIISPAHTCARDDPVDLAALMHLIREQVRGDINTLWLELLVAARTGPEPFPVARGIITFAATRCCHRRRRVRRR
ncbi:hypothetical protein AB0H58_10160 [Nocardia neocaledoniensis]|uniref:hypothetical protein n=1 Tax=Nocardia neocaledoniensis TaxID=236511 RepID=UPI0033EC9E66